MPTRPLYVIAAEIEADCAANRKSVGTASPYLDAMKSLNSIDDYFYQDPASTIVLYFLSNARSYTGPVARLVKAELKGMLK